jgi:hypothetical protein
MHKVAYDSQMPRFDTHNHNRLIIIFLLINFGIIFQKMQLIRLVDAK